MTPLKRNAILLRLVQEMKKRGSWCGETHLQKAAYMLQDLGGAETALDFVLYKHGPFSFELRDEITSMRADDLLDLRIQPQPYGPKLVPTDQATEIENKFPNTLKSNAARIAFIADLIGDKGVSDLEKLATALFVTAREMKGASVAERAARLSEIKPHISLSAATDAVTEVEGLIREAARKGLASNAK